MFFARLIYRYRVSRHSYLTLIIVSHAKSILIIKCCNICTRISHFGSMKNILFSFDDDNIDGYEY